MSYSNEFWRVTGDTSAWHAVAHLGTPARYPKGTVLLDAGKGTGNLYLLEGGQVRMIRTNRDGTERMLMSLEPGSTFGETPLFYDQPLLSSFICSENSCIRTFSKTCLLTQIIPNHPHILQAIVSTMAMKISIFSNQAADMSLADLPSRICKFLLLTTPVAHNTTGEISIRSPLNQSELATLLGVHRVTLYKALKTLESHGIIAGFSRDTVNIADCTRFVACAQMDKI